MTDIRDRMLEELERRNYAPGTARPYLFRERKLAAQAVSAAISRAAVLLRQDAQAAPHAGPFAIPPLPRRLSTVLSREEVGRLLAASAKPDTHPGLG